LKQGESALRRHDSGAGPARIAAAIGGSTVAWRKSDQSRMSKMIGGKLI